jgi:hypothetical protein
VSDGHVSITGGWRSPGIAARKWFHSGVFAVLHFDTRRSRSYKLTAMPIPLRHLISLGCFMALPAIAGDPGSRISAELLWNWPQWRGPLANGIAPHADPPVHWSETKNIRWRIPLPGKAHSSPIVFADRVFLQTAAPVGPAQKPVYDRAPGTHDNVPITHRHQFVALAISRRDGKT